MLQPAALADKTIAAKTALLRLSSTHFEFATICRDLDCFTRAGAACRIPIGLSEAGDTPKCLAPALRPFAVAPRGRSFPPEDRPPPSPGLIEDGADRKGKYR
jgi:hypothetical protein